MSTHPAATPLRLAVVGHTNTGKTSLLRTLTRNPHFGEVRDEAATTRQVESVSLLIDAQPVVELFDTPGLEDSIALLDYIEERLTRGRRPDGPELIQQFLDSPESQGRFEQEARVLRALMSCDAGLVVIDARDPVLAKHRDELRLLACCGKPLMPCLNFTHAPGHRLEQWRDALGRLGLHVTTEFDTVAPALDGEQQLYERLSILMDRHAPTLRAVRDNVIGQRALRRQDGCRIIADMLIDAAAWRHQTAVDEASLAAATELMRETLRTREQACVQSLLRRYNFDAQTFPQHQLPLQGERWEMDLFHPQALKEMGIHLGRGMAAGAMAGATVDAFTAGLSLGTATLLGAAAGGLWQGVDKWGKRLLGRLQGQQELSADDPVLRLLIVRQLALLDALERRGHAAMQEIVLADTPQSPEDGQTDFRSAPLPDMLDAARAHPQWSGMAADHSPSAAREQAVAGLARQLTAALP